MIRRNFIKLIGGSAVAWPFAVRAQQAGRMWRIGLLGSPRRLENFRQGLRDLGYVEGRNFIVEYRAIDQPDRLLALAAELVALKVDVLVASGTQAVRAAQQSTQAIPIVMTGSSDPVGSGFMTSLARPDRNITGISLMTPELSGKRIELLMEVVAGLSRVAVLWNPDDPPAVQALKETEVATRASGIVLQLAEIRRPADFDGAFASIAATRPGALVILAAPVMTINAARISEFALKNALPGVYISREFTDAGGLMSYGPNFDDLGRRAATYVDRILKGAKPVDLPVQQPSKFELVINLKTAKALGITIPQSLLARADEAIE